MESARSNRLAKYLLLTTTLSLGLALLCGYGWYKGRKGNVKLEDLSPTDLSELVHQYLVRTPGSFLRAWFCPNVGYVFAPNVKITTWNDTFASNLIGLRTHPVEKPADVFRVLFVGDSWSYGMGVSEAQSFPAQFEALANQHSGAPKKIQAWNLSMSGWNTENEMSAIECFLERLQPDAVVLCPTENDIDDSQDVAPSGHYCRPYWPADYDLGVKTLCWDSPTTRRRWTAAFARIRQTEVLLKRAKIPLFLFFVGNWHGGEPLAHHLIAEAKMEATYLMVPSEFYGGKWGDGAKDWFHGSPLAYQAFGNMLYQMVAKPFAWKPLPDSLRIKRLDGTPLSVFTAPPPGNWLELYIKNTQANVGHGGLDFTQSFTPGSPSAMQQCWGTMDWDTGLVRRSTAILLLRKAGATKAAIQLARLPNLKYLYPLEVKFTIPSFKQDVVLTQTLTADGPETQTFEVPLPADIAPGAVLEVFLLVPRATLREDFMPQSLKVVRIEQK